MKHFFVMCFSSFFALMIACGDESTSDCSSEEETTCTCADGSLSTQICENGSWASCSCETEDAGNDAEPAAETMILIEAGTFTMGSDSIENASVHSVTLTHSFYIKESEVTQKEWLEVMETRPFYFECEDCPAEQVNWYDAISYANALSALDGYAPCFTIDGEEISVNGGDIYACEGYRLPTEAEWEYAARAGSTTDFYNGEMTNSSGADPTLHEIAWYGENSDEETHIVAQRAANNWGLYDMSGNVWEWIWDQYQADLGTDDVSDPVSDPVGQNDAERFLIRGGNWNSIPEECQSAYRYNLRDNRETDYRYDGVGFRVCRTAE